MRVFCLGFAFYKSEVLLIVKARPDFQKGKLNGLGGTVEAGENSLQAMVNEFYEETSVLVPYFKWFYAGMLNDANVFLNNVRVDVFYAMLSDDEYYRLKHVELQNFVYSKNEPIRFVNIFEELSLYENRNKLMYNIRDIIYKCSHLLHQRYSQFVPIPLTWEYSERLES